jgi:hypothetical protein
MEIKVLSIRVLTIKLAQLDFMIDQRSVSARMNCIINYCYDKHSLLLLSLLVLTVIIHSLETALNIYLLSLVPCG